MKKTPVCQALALLFIINSVNLFSQDYIKFGKFDEKYFAAEKCDFDTSAHAFFIFNEQTCIFDYHQTTVIYDANGMMTQGTDYRNNIHIHRAIKILEDDAAGQWGDFVYPYNPKYDEISSVKGITYNMENGKVVKSKLEKNQIVYEKISPSRENLKLNMPNVKKGSILELEINIASDDFYSLGPWLLQNMIPIEKNIVVFKRPNYYNYNRIFKGYYGVTPKFSQAKRDIQITLKTSDAMSRETQMRTLSYDEYTEEYNMDKVPAFPMESHLSTPYNYLASIMFELSFTDFSGSPRKSFNTSWEAVNNQLLESDDFGKHLNNTSFLRDHATALKAKSTGTYDLANLCYEFVRDTVACDNTLGIFSENSIKDVLKDGKGDVAGMNLLLTALLREAGLNAWPVILSTRGNGMIIQTYPSISNFNYVIVMTEIDGKKILMDASDKYLTMNLLDPICLNDKGRIIDKTRSAWIELSSTENTYARTAEWNVILSEDGTAKATFTENNDNIAAYKERDRIRDKGSYDKYIEDMSHPDEGFVITKHVIDNQNDINKPLVQNLEIELDKGYNTGDLIIFPPLYNEITTDNPFKLAERRYPVEFEYPVSEKVTTRTTIPEGYKVESLPKSKNLTILSGSVTYNYNVSVEDNVVVANYEYRLKRMIFIPDEYAQLKEFFRNLVESQNEKVVLIRAGV